VGDRADLDVLGAAEAGMMTVLVGHSDPNRVGIMPHFHVRRFSDLLNIPLFKKNGKV
ncbi:HAD hydrolase-like protein, partial [bacterium AH-315-F18]|nr:HAD hydrolase-like protein [bacterium AH-315-F18]